MTVWAVSPTANDVSAAAEYGDVKYINTRYVYGDEIEKEELPAELKASMTVAALEFDPLRDYLLLMGDHLQLAAFAAELSYCGHNFRVLRWDRQAKGYLVCWVRAFV